MTDPAKIEVFYNAFREITKIVHSSSDLEEVLELAVWKATEALNAKGAILRILNPDTGELELGAAYGLSGAYLAKGPVTQKDLITDLQRQKRLILIEDIFHDPRIHYPEEVEKEGVRMVLDISLRFQNHIAGILRVYFSESRTMCNEEYDFLISFADQCACAIEKARIMEEQISRYDQLALQTEKLSALGRMAAGIAHEINNPLAGILLYSSNMHKKASGEGPVKEGLEIIMRETQRCKFIIQDLLEFARDKEPKKAPVNVNTVIEKSLSILENEFRLRHIRLERDLSPEPADICADVNQLQQVFVNLLLNAAQAINEKGTITIRSRTDRSLRQVNVDVIDSGCGIPKENMNKIFEPFFSTKKSGSGLGLAVTFGIVKNHDGQLKASSKPGKGSQFTVVLPLAEEKDTREPHDRRTRYHTCHR